MKNFISKNWKNILMIIGGIFIAIDLIFIFTTKNSIPNDFLEYGPDVQQDLFDDVNNIDMSGSNLSETMANNTGLPIDIAKYILIFTFGFIFILILSDIIEGSGKDKKK